MSFTRRSDCFQRNFLVWKIFGIWPGTTSKYYKYYSAIYLFITLIMYIILLTINLCYTPLVVELIIREVIFYFTELVVAMKVLMVIIMRDNILEACDILDSEAFKGFDDVSKQIIKKSTRQYNIYWKMDTILSHISYSSLIILPLLMLLVLNNVILELPICKYYFLSDETRDKYFIYLFIYQSFCIYGHMMYNINIDTFTAGLILMAITQLKVINHKFKNLKLSVYDFKEVQVQEVIQMKKLIQILKHYDLILRYCSLLQYIISLTVFVQFGLASAIICIVMSSLVLPSTTEVKICMVTYLVALTSQIIVPSWLGTQLSYESRELVFAAYNSDWLPRSERFKRTIKLFVERANKPIVLTAFKMFPLSLGTFIAIMKTSYSFFTLVRKVQDVEDKNVKYGRENIH